MNAVTLTAKAFAKINLSLDILDKRTDGYHNLSMVMASVSLCDDLTVTLAPCGPGEARFTASSDGASLPEDEKNLAARAARLFIERYGPPGWGARIGITKRIPVSAGLGGGSSDGAAVLRALAGWRAIEPETLAGLALELGSDVPYCLRGGVCFAEGRGEKLTSLNPLPDCLIVLSVPPVAVSTAEAFRRFDSKGTAASGGRTRLADALGRRDLRETAALMRNSFEGVCPPPEVAEIKGVLIGAGALGALMSGSGPAVFGIFDDKIRAKEAFDALHPIFPNTFITKSV